MMWPDLDPDSMGYQHMMDALDSELSGDEYPRTVQCRYCKRDGFHWLETDTGWRLATETGRLHSCKAHKKEEAA